MTSDLIATVARDEHHLDAMHKLVGRMAMCVPMVRRDRVLGALFMTTRDDETTFTDEDVALAAELGRRAAVALDNARRFRVEHDVASALQRSLLPQSLPETAGLEHCARYLPAASEAQIGGDWYDVVALSDGSIAIVVGDVAGKGVQAAAVMGQLRASVRAYVWEGHPPAAVLKRLDELFGALDLTDFTTAVVGIYDPASRVLTYATAGHMPMLVVAKDGTGEFLPIGGGTPLGLASSDFTDETVALEPGSMVVLYTDGLVERRGESIDAGLDRLRAVACTVHDDIDQMCDAIIARLVPASGPPDDAALLVVRAT